MGFADSKSSSETITLIYARIVKEVNSNASSHIPRDNVFLLLLSIYISIFMSERSVSTKQLCYRSKAWDGALWGS